MAEAPDSVRNSSQSLSDPVCRTGVLQRFGLHLAARAFFVLLFLGTCLPGVVPAGEESGKEAAAKLELLRERIRGLKKELVSMRGKRDAHQEKLEKVEKEIGAVTVQLRVLDVRAKEANDSLGKLQRDFEIEQGHLKRTTLTLEKELQLAYMTGRQEQVKLLLNQENPAALGRLMVYHDYFSRARTRAMQELRDSMKRLAGIEREAVLRRGEISALIGQQQDKSAQLLKQRDRRRIILARLNDKLSNRTDQLSRLEEDEGRLQKLVQSLQRAISEIRPAKRKHTPIPTLKGQLRWPVAGRISVRYGEKQFSGKLRTRGVHIITNDDAEVRVIAGGRVVFADWLRGFGLLIIIDHGDKYMSLYGHNNSLFKDVGDRVERDEVIAAAGSSGGKPQAGLYLELRKSGRPINPSAWFKGSPKPLKAAGRASR